MRIAVLGPVTASTDDGTPLAVGGPRVRALLALLALEAGSPVPVPRLMDVIWGRDRPADVTNALHTLVKRLRQACGRDTVAARSGGYVLAVAPGDVDAHRFAALTAHARQQAADNLLDEAVRTLDLALAQWSGPALADLAGQGALAAVAHRLDEARLGAVELLADCRHALGRDAESVADLTAHAATDPLRESLIARLMVALTAAGRRSQALALYQNTRETLAEELGIDPGEELATTYLDILREESPALAQAKSALPEAAPQPGPRAPLPRALTSFVGRERELDAISTLVPYTPLLTLTGPGGSGKTRLAVEAATALAARFPDGVRLVELAGVTDSALVDGAALAALDIRDDNREPDDTRTVAEVIADALVRKRMLLILDNCEHVLAGVAQLVETLLRLCPDGRILATSREPLDVPGERLLPVPALALAPFDADLEQTAQSSAVRLFTDRAAAVRPGFVLDTGNCAAVSAICHELDGLPLALELAATRMRALTPADLAAGLADRFGLLAAGPRTAAPRHRSLRAVVEWSWDLLTDGERDLARRLSVFAGGLTAETAREVYGPGAVATLASLVDKSFVHWDGARYRMLETIRAFAGEDLAASGGLAEAALRQATFVAGLVEKAEPALRTAGQPQWIARLAAEHDNCVTALDWAVRTGEAALALRVFGSMSWYLLLRGLRVELSTWRDRVLSLVPDGPPPGLASAYLAAAHAADLQDYLDPERWDGLSAPAGRFAEMYRRAVQEARKPHPMFTIVMALYDPGSAGQRASEQLSGLVGSSDPWLSANALLLRGGARINEGDYALAETDLTKAVDGFRAVGDTHRLIRALLTLAIVQMRGSGPGSPDSLLDEAVALIERWSEGSEAVATLAWAAHLRYWGGDLDGADAVLAMARARLGPGLPAAVGITVWVTEADVLRERGDVAGALARYAAVFGAPDDADTARPDRAGGPADSATATVGAYPAATHRLAPHPVTDTAGEETPTGASASAGEIWGRAGYAMALLHSETGEGSQVEAAREQLAFAVTALRAAWHVPLLAATAVAAADLALALGEPETAATMLGAVATLFAERTGGPHSTRVRKQALGVLGPEAFAEVADVGAKLGAQGLYELLRTWRGWQEP
jgi:predicted ATPase/DNA-binding SARP family transcriptional activator